MGENRQEPAPAPARLGMRGGGEIVEVQGGHIVRSTGRKDRHSKVCTAKGPRDRRVRLSAHTAIQFYDVQDRLGYDRPSKAVDWLIKKAKSAIDELAELPPWHPIASAAAEHQQEKEREAHKDSEQQQQQQHNNNNNDNNSTATIMMDGIGGISHSHSQSQNSSFLPPSLDSDAIADTIKSFFPMGAAAQPPPPPQFHHYPPPDLLSRTSSQSQDLRLSLQSFQDHNFLHQHNHHHHQHHQHQQQQQSPCSGQVPEHGLFSGNAHLGFDSTAAGWPEQHHHPAAEMGRFQRMVSSSWNNAGAAAAAAADNAGGGGEAGGATFMFASPPAPQQPLLQPLFGSGQNQFYSSQRGPLQSSNTPSIRAWMDPPQSSSGHHQFPFQSSSMSGIGFASGGFSGFHIPARIQGQEEHDGLSNKPSSASSDSRH